MGGDRRRRAMKTPAAASARTTAVPSAERASPLEEPTGSVAGLGAAVSAGGVEVPAAAGFVA